MKTNNQKITPEATHTYFYDGWQLIKETRHPAASQSGSDAAGSRVSMCRGDCPHCFTRLVAASPLMELVAFLGDCPHCFGRDKRDPPVGLT